ncbi:MAG: glycosyltransferase family 4 protein [Solirubrobacterales bacterium]
MAATGDPLLARIAVVQQGDPADPRTWSGVPASLLRGLEAAGCEALPVGALFPGAGKAARLFGMSWADQAGSRAYAAACSAAANRALRKAGPLDGAVTIGSGYAVSVELPTVTFEDMTLAQAISLPGDAYESVGERPRRRWLKRQRSIYRHSRACCVGSHWAAASVRDDYGIPADKIHVVGFGRNAEPDRVERDWSVPRFLFVGADWKRKRGDAVVKSFDAVKQRYPTATLDLVGGHPHVDADGVTGHGELPLDSADAQHKYRELIHNATCFVMPSAYEPFGIAYLDAGAAGLASIGTTVGGAPDAVGNGGIVVDPNDEDALTTAMVALSEPGYARRLGERAFERSQLFTWKAVAERLLRALRPAGIDVDRLTDFLAPAHVGS